MSNESTTLRQGVLLVITAPSGAGKSTLVTRLCAHMEDVRFSISYTTRTPRLGEEHGREYFFVSHTEFQQMCARNEFLEWAEVYNNYYGTHRDSIAQSLAEGKDIVLDIDVQGAEQIKQLMPEAILIFIMPPSFAVLEQRLNRRGLDSPAVMAKRLSVAVNEVNRYRKFDYVIVNDDLEQAAAQLMAIVYAERQRPQRLERRLEKILSNFPAN